MRISGWWNRASDTATEQGTELSHVVGSGHCSSSSEMDIKSYFISHGENKNMWPHFTTYCRGFHPKPPQLLFLVLPFLLRSFRGREFRILHDNHTILSDTCSFSDPLRSHESLLFSFGILENLNFIVVLMATDSSILAWRIPWTEEPCGLQSMGSKESDMTE